MAGGDFRSRTASHDGYFFNNRTLVSLIVGLVVGSYMAQLFIISTSTRSKWMTYSDYLHNHIHRPSFQYDERNGNQNDVAEVPEKEFHEHKHTSENTSVAQRMYEEVRVLCLIVTKFKSLKGVVNRTWGKRCNKIIFFGAEEDKLEGVVALNMSKGRHNLWGKTKEAFKYAYKHHIDEYDWFFKAHDDTYAIMENMRYFLYPYSTETPIYFGARFKPMIRQGYMSGGAGYVLSKEAVRRFVNKALPNPEICKQLDTGDEDVHMGWCLQNVDVMAGDTRDSQARGRFFPFKAQDHLKAKPNNWFWYWKYIYYKTDEGLDCCSDYAITFHQLNGGGMLVLDFLVYHLRPYGIVNLPEELPKKLEIGHTLPSPTEPPNSLEEV